MNKKLLIKNQQIMKKVIYLLALPLIFMYGCSNDETLSPEPGMEAAKLEMFSIDGKGNISNIGDFTFEDMRAKSNASTAYKGSDNSIVNGHFSTDQDNTITFASGKGGNSGTFSIRGAQNFKGDLICASTEENRTVLQVVVTSVGELPIGYPDILGWTFLYLLEDNGEGNNADSDQYFTFTLVAPGPILECDGISPSIFIGIYDFLDSLYGIGATWEPTFKTSDQIQIK